MTDNVNRYAFVDFTPKPYINNFGVPYQKFQCNNNNNNNNNNINNQNRTIIRTLQNAPNSRLVVPSPANQQFMSQAPVSQQNKMPVQRKISIPNNSPMVPINAPMPYNQAKADYLTNYQDHSAPNAFNDLWSKFVRKDNMFERYSCDCDK
jgi:hypothetical protein